MLATLLILFVLGIVIAFHEFGHLFFAKLFGVFVERFSIGFGPVLLSKKVKETEYALSLIPFGGYIKMADEDGGSASADPKKSYGKKPIWQRFLILLAGPLFNFFLGALLFIASFAVVGVPIFTPSIGSVKAGSPAEKAGLKIGDRILAIETVKKSVLVKDWSDMLESVQRNGADEISFTIERGSEILKIRVKPELTDDRDQLGSPTKRYIIGVSAAAPIVVKDYKKAVAIGLYETANAVKMTAVGFWQIVTGKLAAKDSLGGPIQIFRGGGEIYGQSGLVGLMIFAAFISINLGFLNLLPIPMLDGGYMPFLLVELIRGKPVSRKTRDKIFGFGFAVLILLMIMTTYFDLMRIFVKK